MNKKRTDLLLAESSVHQVGSLDLQSLMFSLFLQESLYYMADKKPSGHRRSRRDKKLNLNIRKTSKASTSRHNTPIEKFQKSLQLERVIQLKDSLRYDE